MSQVENETEGPPSEEKPKSEAPSEAEALESEGEECEEWSGAEDEFSRCSVCWTGYYWAYGEDPPVRCDCGGTIHWD
jgi:hypothetical protein